MPKTIVIQCAKRKHGGYLRATNGDKVRFVAEAQIVTPQSGWTSVRLDDPAEFGATWRMVLSAYNDRFAQTGDNPDNLQPARQLYVDPAYRGFVRVFGVDNLYILSAGWGLVHACYLLPNYDITFSNQADQFSIGRKGMSFLDAK